MNRLSPPAGFASHDWYEEIESDELIQFILERNWAEVVAKFVSGCERLDNATEQEPMPSSPYDRPRVHSRTSSRASSISEGHVSPEDDGPSKKVPDFGG